MKISYHISILSLLTAVILSIGCGQGSQASSVEITDLYHTSVGQGSPIIVIHGGPGLGSSYLENHLQKLSEKHQVIFYDQRNSGRSPLSIDTSKVRLSAFIEDIERLRQYYNLDTIAVLGHSWGGLLAMNYATAFENNVSHLILVNSITANSELNNKANTKLANRFSADDIEAMTRIKRTKAFLNQNPKAYEELMEIGFGYQFSDPNKIKQLVLNLPEDFGKKSEQLGNLFQDLSVYNFTEKMMQIKCPTLLLYGIDDPLTPYAINSLGAIVPGATIEVINDAGHFPFIEKNEETIGIIHKFLQ